MVFKVSSVSKYLRPGIQAVCFLIVIVLFINMEYPASMPFSNPLLAADPVAVAGSIIFYRGSWMPALLPVAALLLASAVLGRAFCGWVCPVGFLVDITDKISGLFKKRIRSGRYGYLQYGIFAAVLLYSMVTLDVLSILDPFVILQRSIYLLWHNAGIPAILLLVLACSVVIAPRFWCRAICPAGAAIGIVSAISPFKFRMDDCKKCMRCHRACPMGAISRDGRWDATACIKCLDCERACPDSKTSFAASRPAMPGISVSRRSMLAAGVAAGLFAVSKGTATLATGDRPLIRPPGSLVEYKFNDACTRCESCAKACLGKVIRPAGIDAGLERLFTPLMDFRTGKCERCGTCGQVCPTGAIISVPVDKIKIGTARIDTGKCIAWKEGKSCLICMEICPVSAVKGAGKLQPVVVSDTCVGCGACELNCPVKDKAITISNEGELRRVV